MPEPSSGDEPADSDEARGELLADWCLTVLGGPLYSWNLMIFDLAVLLMVAFIFFFATLLESSDDCMEVPTPLLPLLLQPPMLLLLLALLPADSIGPAPIHDVPSPPAIDELAINDLGVMIGRLCDVNVKLAADGDCKLPSPSLASRGVMSGGGGIGGLVTDDDADDISLHDSGSCGERALSLALLSASDSPCRSPPPLRRTLSIDSMCFGNCSFPSVWRETYRVSRIYIIIHYYTPFSCL